MISSSRSLTIDDDSVCIASSTHRSCVRSVFENFFFRLHPFFINWELNKIKWIFLTALLLCSSIGHLTSSFFFFDKYLTSSWRSTLLVCCSRCQTRWPRLPSIFLPVTTSVAPRPSVVVLFFFDNICVVVPLIPLKKCPYNICILIELSQIWLKSYKIFTTFLHPNNLLKKHILNALCDNIN